MESTDTCTALKLSICVHTLPPSKKKKLQKILKSNITCKKKYAVHTNLHMSHRRLEPGMQFCCCSVTKSGLTLCDPMNGSTRARLLCPLLSPEVCSNLCSLNQWRHLTISSSADTSPFSFNISQHPNSSKSVLPIRWPKYWSFSFSISPSNEYSGFVSFRIDWLALLAIQEIVKSLLQHQGSEASILWHSAFLMVQFSHLYMTTGKP